MLFLLRNKARLILSGAGILGALFAPPWVPLLVMILLSIRYSAWEVLAIGLLVDLMWFTPSAVDGLLGLFPLFTIAGVALLWGLEPLRSEFLLKKDVLV